MADLAKLNIAVNTRGARQQLGAFRTAMATTSRAVTNQVNRIQGAFSRVTGAIFGLQGALAGVGVALGAGAVVQTSLRLDRLKTALSAVSGNAKETEKTLGILRNMSNRLGIDFLTTAESFKNFSIATRASGMDVELSNDIFEGFVTASSAMKLSSDDLSGALRALQQMVSKGNVQAEELRGQLGERLPGAFAMSAEALGVTTVQLNKMLDRGEVLADDLLPKLGKLMKERFSEPAKVASQSATAEFNRFGNAIDDVKIALGASGLIGVLVHLAKSMVAFIDSGGFMKLFEGALIGSAKFLDAFRAIAQTSENFFNDVVTVLNNFDTFTGGIMKELGIIGFLFFGKKGLLKAGVLGIAVGLIDELLFKAGEALETFNKSIGITTPESIESVRILKSRPLGSGVDTAMAKVLSSAGFSLDGNQMSMSEFRRVSTPDDFSFEKRARKTIELLKKQREEASKLGDAFSGNFGGGGKVTDRSFLGKLKELFEGASTGFEKMGKDIGNMAKIGENAVTKAFGAMDNAVESFVKTGKISMKEFGQEMLIYFAQVSAKMAVITAFGALKPNLMSLLTGFGGGTPVPVAGAGSVGAPPMAYGGAVSRGSPYLVGERGAEIFVPNQSGRIVPNAGGSTIVNNYDFRGADRSAVAQLEMMAENIKQETFKMVFGSIEQGGRFAKATGRRA